MVHGAEVANVDNGSANNASTISLTLGNPLGISAYRAVSFVAHHSFQWASFVAGVWSHCFASAWMVEKIIPNQYMTPSVFIVGAPLAATLLEKSVSSNNVTKGGQKETKKRCKGEGKGGTNGWHIESFSF